MITINGKKYKINLDIKWDTQKRMKEMQDEPDNPKNIENMEFIIKDILRPRPSNKELLEFRKSHIEKAFKLFVSESNKLDTEYKKKLS